MRRITFFIGNGFDINVGLPTKYSQFYEYYKRNYPEDLLAKDIASDYEYWADMEVGLGKYTSKVKMEDADLFWESEERLEQALADYLDMQTKDICVDPKENAEILKKSLLGFYEELPKEQKMDISERIRGIKENITYSFISFNYTNVLDLCIEAGREVFPKEIGSHKSDSGVTYAHTLGDVLHIHGTINEELILGVNDASQIANDEFCQNMLYKQLLLKEEANKRFGQNKIQEARQIINESSIICTFGTSIGVTDRMWWGYICNWLQKSISHRLIIYAKNDKPISRITKHLLFSRQNAILENLKMNSGLGEEEWNQIRNRIYIKFDSEIFGFKIMHK